MLKTPYDSKKSHSKAKETSILALVAGLSGAGIVITDTSELKKVGLGFLLGLLGYGYKFLTNYLKHR